MIMPSQYYRNLEKQLRVLKKSFMPATFSATGNYSAITHERTRAYKVLSHAEFEYYFEVIACAIAKKAVNDWIKSGKSSSVLVALVSYYDGSFKPIPEQKGGNNSAEGLSQRIQMSLTSYIGRVNAHNNGIKEKNIFQIFLPISLLLGDFDDGFLLALNNFGASRGIIAHSTRANQLLDPKDTLQSVTEIVSYVKELDEKLCKLLK